MTIMQVILMAIIKLIIYNHHHNSDNEFVQVALQHWECLVDLCSQQRSSLQLSSLFEGRRHTIETFYLKGLYLIPSKEYSLTFIVNWTHNPSYKKQSLQSSFIKGLVLLQVVKISNVMFFCSDLNRLFIFIKNIHCMTHIHVKKYN